MKYRVILGLVAVLLQAITAEACDYSDWSPWGSCYNTTRGCRRYRYRHCVSGYVYHHNHVAENENCDACPTPHTCDTFLVFQSVAESNSTSHVTCQDKNKLHTEPYIQHLCHTNKTSDNWAPGQDVFTACQKKEIIPKYSPIGTFHYTKGHSHYRYDGFSGIFLECVTDPNDEDNVGVKVLTKVCNSFPEVIQIGAGHTLTSHSDGHVPVDLKVGHMFTIYWI